MTGWVKGYLLLGSNVGDRAAQMAHAITAIQVNGVQVQGLSDIYETAPWGVSDQPSFLNRVVAIQTSLSPLNLLKTCQQIETDAGPQKSRHWGERHLDIDILYYGNRIIDHPLLSVPHPRLSERRFTLVPLVEVAPKWLHPSLLRTNSELLDTCADTLTVAKWQEYAA